MPENNRGFEVSHHKGFEIMSGYFKVKLQGKAYPENPSNISLFGKVLLGKEGDDINTIIEELKTDIDVWLKSFVEEKHKSRLAMFNIPYPGVMEVSEILNCHRRPSCFSCKRQLDNSIMTECIA